VLEDSEAVMDYCCCGCCGFLVLERSTFVDVESKKLPEQSLVTHHSPLIIPRSFSFLESRPPSDNRKTPNIPKKSIMATSLNNDNTIPRKMSRSWRLGVFGIVTVARMVVLSALSNIFPSTRNSFDLFDRQLQFKDDSDGPLETLPPTSSPTTSSTLTSSPPTLSPKRCSNEECQTQCSRDYVCESEDYQAACNGEDEEKDCGCTERQPTCFKIACKFKCRADPACEKDSSCANTCLSPPRALTCGCGLENECFNGSCFNLCKSDPLCATQTCQDVCVTPDNTVARGCGCIRSECGHQ
jgi:hypothetical protein